MVLQYYLNMGTDNFQYRDILNLKNAENFMLWHKNE